MYSTRHGYTPLAYASSRGHLNVVKILIRNKAGTGCSYDGDKAVLHVAASNGHREVVQELLDNEACVDVTTPQGLTPLMWAVYMRHLETAEILIRHQATGVGSVGNNGLAPLHFAVGNVNATREYSINNVTTSLHGAACSGHRKKVQLLLL